MFSSPLTLEYTDLYQLINHVKLETQYADHSLGTQKSANMRHVTHSCLLVSSSKCVPLEPAIGWNKHVMEMLL